MKHLDKLYTFYNWIDKNQEKSYDQYDFWASSYGIFSKIVYYKNKLLGSPFVASIFILDILTPWLRNFLFKKNSCFQLHLLI